MILPFLLIKTNNMQSPSLSQFIDKLKQENELLQVKVYVNPVLEIAEITDRISKQDGGGKALMFEKNGTRFPVLINAMGSEKRMKMILGVKNLDDIGEEIFTLFSRITDSRIKGLWSKIGMIPALVKISGWMPKKIKRKGRCQQIVYSKPDLTILPILKCWPEDGGRFITLPMVITQHPETGARNVGMYRMQVFNKNTTGMHWHRHKTGAAHFEANKSLGKRMPISVALGGDPVLSYSATAPLPENIDEFMFAGFLRKQKVKLVKCITNDLWVPEEADIIIEGYVDPDEEFVLEGPFGDHTGFYSLADLYPKMHVTCITHKRKAVYPATIVGIPPMEDAWIGKATERIFLNPIRLSVAPEIEDIDLPFEGVAHNIVVAKISKTYPGQVPKVANALWGAGQMMFNKILLAVDKVPLKNYSQLFLHVMKNFEPEEDIYFMKGPLDVLDHSSPKFSYGSKMVIDATTKYPEEKEKERSNEEKVVTEMEIKHNKIHQVNDHFIKKSIPFIAISVNKDLSFKLKEFVAELSSKNNLSGLKMIVLYDKEVDITDSRMMAWLGSGNIDPLRDCFIQKSNGSSMLFVDATRKNKSSDEHLREWPNVIVSSDETINEIDSKWKSLDLGDFISSPSLKYKKLIINKGPSIKNQ